MEIIVLPIGFFYRAGYEANILSNQHKNTWRFETNQGNLPMAYIADENGNIHTYSMNIYFAKNSAPDGYCYYRCSINEEIQGKKVQKKLFYGVVNVKNGRDGCKSKAYLIYSAYFAQAASKQDITKGFEYSESVIFFSKNKENLNEASTSHSFQAALYGDIVFQYETGKGLTPVSSYIKGELHYSFEHKQQFVVWVIPIYLQINVKLDGEIEIRLAYDEWRSVSIEEAQMTLSAEITAKVGVGCEIISVGVYGTIGTVFVLDFAPDFGVEKWTVSGKLALYATFYTLTWRYPFVVQTTKEHAIFDKTYTIIDNTGASTWSRRVDATTFYMSAMFLAESYEPAEPSDCAEEAKLFVYKDDLYKIHFVSLLGNDSSSEVEGEYDAYNYRKIGISKWTGSDWDETVILDDNGINGSDFIRNDLDFTLYEENGGITVVFTQHAGKITAEIAEDSTEYVSNLVVKYVHLDDLSQETIQAKTPDVVFDGGDYKYLTTTATVNSIPTVVWAENADNNMFGVSPYNYVSDESDPNASFHVFETTANSIWMSQYVNEKWTAPVCVKNSLSAVTDIAVSDDGTIVYIVDENGNLADIDDRKMYCTDVTMKEISCVDHSEYGVALDVEATKDGFLGYFSSKMVSGLKHIDLANTEAVNDWPENTSMLTDMYKILYNEHGEKSVILYVQNKVWTEEGESVDGATIYAMFREDGVWGNPIEITTSTIYPIANRYITSFDAAWIGGEIMLAVEYVFNRQDGQGIADATVSLEMDTYALASNIVVDGESIHYSQKTLTVDVTNHGARSTQIYAIINDTARIRVCDNLISGESRMCEIEISGFGSVVNVKLMDVQHDQEVYSTQIDLTYADLQPFVKQLLLGSHNNSLLVAVKNNGNIAGNGTLHIAVGNYSKANPEYGEEYLDKLTDISLKRSIKALGAGKIVYFEIPLSNTIEIDENTIVTIYVEPEDFPEKGDSQENNLLYATLQSYTSAVADDGTSYVPVLDAFVVTYDSEAPADITIGYCCSTTNFVRNISVDGVVLEKGIQYSVSDNNIILKQSYLSKIPPVISIGEPHKIVITFEDGTEFEVQLNMVEYYQVTWLNGDGTILQEQSCVAQGSVPNCDRAPTKTSDSEGIMYSFVGWDSDGDNEADKIDRISGNVVYTPVWRECSTVHTVTWVFESDAGEIIVEEEYEYGSQPDYRGKKFQPSAKEFVGWNKTPDVVTQGATYYAVYKKTVTGSADIKNSEFVIAPGGSFVTTLRLENVTDMSESTITVVFDTNIVSLAAVVMKNGVECVEYGDGYMIIAVNNLVSGKTNELCDITFNVLESLSAGEYALFTVLSEDQITNALDNAVVYQSGDVNGDGVVNTRDLAILRQYVVGKIELTMVQLYYANFYMDYDSDGNPKINTRDIALLQQHIVA